MAFNRVFLPSVPFKPTEPPIPEIGLIIKPIMDLSKVTIGGSLKEKKEKEF